MTRYCDITLGRYMRVIIRMYVDLKEIGFSDKVLQAFLEIATKEIIRKSWSNEYDTYNEPTHR